MVFILFLHILHTVEIFSPSVFQTHFEPAEKSLLTGRHAHLPHTAFPSDAYPLEGAVISCFFLPGTLKALTPVHRQKHTLEFYSIGTLPAGKISATVCFVEVKTVSELAPVHWFCPVYVWNIGVRTSHTNHLRTPAAEKKSMPEIPGTSVPFCGRKKRDRRPGNQKHRSLFPPHPLTLFTGWPAGRLEE